VSLRGSWLALVAPALLAEHSAAYAAADVGTGAAHAAPFEWHLPRGFPMPAVPADNPMSAEKVALGRRLFFEPRLSVTGRYSCASCHDPARVFTDGRAVAVGATGQTLTRSAMSLVNAAYNISFGWTKPEVLSLEQQMLEPLLNQHPVELGLAEREPAVCAMLAADADYAAAFAQAFPRDAQPPSADRPASASGDYGTTATTAADGGNDGAERRLTSASSDHGTTATTATDGGNDGADRRAANAAGAVTFDHLIKAIAAFERTLIAGDSPFDHYVFRGEHDALSAQEKRGMQLFYSARAGCGTCHSGFNFNGNWRDSKGVTGESAFANNGVGDQPMRVPTLRNIALTAPYMHDGRFGTLEAVLDHYASVAQQPGSDPKLRTFNLSPAERSDLIAFLHALTDPQFAGR
jgi:cytochrome c peroxidase